MTETRDFSLPSRKALRQQGRLLPVEEHPVPNALEGEGATSGLAATAPAPASGASRGEQNLEPDGDTAPRRVRRRDLRLLESGEEPERVEADRKVSAAGAEELSSSPGGRSLPLPALPLAEAVCAAPGTAQTRATGAHRRNRSGRLSLLTRGFRLPSGRLAQRTGRTWLVWVALVAVAILVGVLAAVLQHNAAEQNALEEARRSAFTSVQVSGRLGSTPTLTLVNPVEAQTAPRHRVVLTGSGSALEEGDRIVLAVTTFDGRTGKRILPGSFPHVDVVEMSSAGLGETLYSALQGQRDGARVLLLNSVEKDGGTYPELAVVDVLLRQLPVPAADQSPSAAIEGDLKSMVSFDANSVPQLAPWGVATQIVKVEELLSGTGEQVAKGDTVVVQYVVSSWDGKVRDSTYAGLGPQEVMVASLQPGLAEAVIDRAVGSRIVLAAPAALTDGNADILAVVDILAISDRGR